jgi:transitional endoplasmic reticulum ATPase
MASSTTALHAAHEAIKDHKSERIPDTRLTVHTSLLEQYPDHYLTSVDSDNVEFLDFAEAGHAKAVLDTSDSAVQRSRSYVAPMTGRVWVYATDASREDLGTLRDDVHCGRYDYEWKGLHFLLYKVTWVEGGYREKTNYWLLYPKSLGSVNADGHCAEIDALLLALGKWATVPHNNVYVFDQGFWRRSKPMWESIKDSRWEDVILEPALKAQLMADVQGFFAAETKAVYSKFRVPYKRGIILHGAPGNGKTISVKALIAHLMRLDDKVPTLYVKSTADMCNGEHKSIERIFQYARKSAPCLLVLEDLDSLVSHATKSYFLNEVDGLECNDGILMIGSTNHLDKLDVAITKRPSRFDRKYNFRLPELEQRVQYSEYWRSQLDQTSMDFPTEVSDLIGQLTEGFSFAYLKELFVSTLLAVARGATGDEVEYDVVGEKSAESSEKGDETPKDGEENKEDTKENEPAKKKREVPTIEVPEPLKENVFFKVLRLQMVSLIQDMNDAEESEDEANKKKQEKQEKKGKKKSEDESACSKCK